MQDYSTIRATNCDSEACGVASKAQSVLFWVAQLAADRLAQFCSIGRAGGTCTLVLSVLILLYDSVRPICLALDCFVYLSVSTQHLCQLFGPLQTTRETHEEIWS